MQVVGPELPELAFLVHELTGGALVENTGPDPLWTPGRPGGVVHRTGGRNGREFDGRAVLRRGRGDVAVAQDHGRRGVGAQLVLLRRQQARIEHYGDNAAP